MTNALVTIDLSAPAGLPAYLQAYHSDGAKNLLVGGTTFGNRIGLKGCRFRLVVNGQEEGVIEDNFLDLVIVGAAPGVSRLYYADAYSADVKVAPTCYSKDGQKPAEDVKTQQSDTGAKCPMNEKGSKITEGGMKTRACSFFKRLAVVLPSDPERVYRLDAKGMSIFGEGKPAQNKFSVSEYGKKLATRGIDPAHLVTRFTFDTDESVPKLLLSPHRYLDEAEVPTINDVVLGDEVKNALDISSATVDLSGEVTPAEPAAVAEPAPVKAAGPTITRGPVVTKAAAPAVTKAAAAPAVTKAAAAPAVARTAPPVTAKPVVTQVAQAPAQAIGDEDDLQAILDKLDAE
jgi:hypothetical protein